MCSSFQGNKVLLLEQLKHFQIQRLKRIQNKLLLFQCYLDSPSSIIGIISVALVLSCNKTASEIFQCLKFSLITYKRYLLPCILQYHKHNLLISIVSLMLSLFSQKIGIENSLRVLSALIRPLKQIRD